MTRFKNPHGRTRGERIDPKPSHTGSTNSATPVFCLKYLQAPYCVTSCQKDEQAALAVKLRELSNLTWQQITQAHRHGAGTEKIDRDRIRATIPAGITEDVQFFLAFRFFGKAPMIGFRSGEVFHVVWLDRDFTVYPHS